MYMIMYSDSYNIEQIPSSSNLILLTLSTSFVL